MTSVNSETLNSSDALRSSIISPEPVVDFAPPFLLRVGSLLVDYIIFLALPLTGLVSDRLMGGNGFGVFTDRTIWLLAVILSVVNIVFLPLIAGQTFGKILTGIRIVKADGSPSGRGSIFVRQTIGYLLTLATLGIGFLVSALNPSGRSLHDYIAGTVTVRAQRRLVKV